MSDLELLQQRFADGEIELLARIAAGDERFTRRDEVLVRLGTELLARGRVEQAMSHLRELITEYPRSPHVGTAFLALADYYFGRTEIDKALQLYEKALALGDPTHAPYARFKLGWCWFNQGDHVKALQSFVRAAESAQRQDSESALALRTEALKDMVRAYAFIGRPDKAAPFFERVAPERVDELLEQLATILFDDGKYVESIAVHRELMARVECSTVLATSQLAIFEGRLLLGERDEVRIAARQLADVFVKLGECLPATELAGLAELGSDARETLKEQAAAARQEYDSTREPAALSFAEDLEAAAESIY
jgi:tetratricopeptide (TPR) repeat protein